MKFTLKQMAEHLGAELKGDGDIVIRAVASVDVANEGDLTFVTGSKYTKKLEVTGASAVLITEDMQPNSPVAALVVANPRAAYARAVALLYPQWAPSPGIDRSAQVDNTAQVANSAYIGPNVVVEAGVKIAEDVIISSGCVIGRNSSIGRSSYLHSNVTVYNGCIIGEHCILHSACVIGSDGFGFEFDEGEWLKIPQVGGVLIGNKVEIGACSVVDRGALNDTVIEDDVKLDNHVQIAHNVYIGEHTLMSRGVGIAGSTHIGKNCLFAGMVGVVDHIKVTDGVTVTAMSMVSKSLSKPGSYSSNTPIDDTRSWRKNGVRFKQLDEMAKRIRQLEKLIQEKG